MRRAGNRISLARDLKATKTLMNQAESLADRELNSELSLLIKLLRVRNWWRRRELSLWIS